jgi:hypothetical protein
VCQYEKAEVLDLRDGRLVLSAPASMRGHGGAIDDLELKPNGSVAVIGFGDPYSPDPVHVVWAYDTLGWRVLDRGNISERSLRLSGSTLTWVKDGVVRSATLN